MNNTAMNICAQVLHIHDSLEYIHMIRISWLCENFLTFGGTAWWFPKGGAPFYILTARVWGLQFLLFILLIIAGKLCNIVV
jgi:hypothetical protein